MNNKMDESVVKPDTKRPSKDSWDKADILFKGLVALAVGVLLFVGNQHLGALEDQSRERQRRDSRRETLVQMTATRQAARLALKSQVFGQLLTNLLDATDFPHRIRLMELLGLNFGNAVQLKPLFEGVDSDLLASELDDARKQEYQTDLRDVAQRLIRYQLDQIQGASDGIVCVVTLRREEDVTVMDFPGTLHLRLLDKEPNGRWINVGVDSPDLFRGNSLSFRVAYYDMPFVDYTTIEDDIGAPLRYSVVLLDAGVAPDTARVAVVVLPDVFKLENTFYFEDQLLDFVENPLPDSRIVEEQ